MPGSVSIVVFGAVVIVAGALIYAFSGESVVVSQRLGRLWRSPGQRRDGSKTLGWDKVASATASIVRLLPTPSTRGSDPRLIQAGFRRPEAAAMLQGARVVTILALVAVVYLTGIYRNNPILFIIAIVGGFIVPDFWLGARVRSRQQTLRLALPDALDLLVICMEAGLGLDQSLLYVSQELRIAHPELCAEFDMVNAEMHVGKSRVDSLRSLAERTGVDDLQALAATLIQTDRFGTSVAQSLRVHSDDLRTKRRQRAEEMAAKTTVKMLLPLVFFIFPALFVVILGPAVITMLHTMPGLSH